MVSYKTEPPIRPMIRPIPETPSSMPTMNSVYSLYLLAAREKQLVLMEAEAHPYRALNKRLSAIVPISLSISTRKPTGMMEMPMQISPNAIKLAKPTRIMIFPMMGDTKTTAIEYIAKTRPTQNPGTFLFMKTLGRKRLASA